MYATPLDLISLLAFLLRIYFLPYFWIERCCRRQRSGIEEKIVWNRNAGAGDRCRFQITIDLLTGRQNLYVPIGSAVSWYAVWLRTSRFTLPDSCLALPAWQFYCFLDVLPLFAFMRGNVFQLRNTVHFSSSRIGGYIYLRRGRSRLRKIRPTMNNNLSSLIYGGLMRS